MAQDDDFNDASDSNDDAGPISRKAAEVAKQQILFGGGYQQPPRNTRFRKGQSGNPKGRPRGIAKDLSLRDQPTLEAVYRASRKLLKMREGDKIVEIRANDAIFQATVASAVKGNARSQGLAIDLMRTAEQTHAHEIAERNEYWRTYKEQATARLEAAAARKQPPPEILPHPDDILIDRYTGPRFIGPFDEQELSVYRGAQELCDVLLMQNALDARSDTDLHGEPLTQPGSALLLFLVFQQLLPLRMQMPQEVIFVRIGRFRRLPKRILVKELHAAWRRAGLPIRRGTVMPDHGKSRTRLELMFTLCREAIAGRIDLEAVSRGEFSDNVHEVCERFGIALE